MPERFPAVRLVRLAPETAPKEPDQVPLVTVPVVVRLEDPARGEAPSVLYEIVCAAEPLNVVGEVPPAPPLLKVTLFATLPAVPLVEIPAVEYHCVVEDALNSIHPATAREIATLAPRASIAVPVVG